MNHGSLFSGIGGFDLAAEWMGWENIFHCEWNPFGQKVLKHYWPNAESFHDITKTDFTPYANRIDILTGGFPCQPYSLAGKRKGKEDERHLWPEMLRAIREISPRWVVGENVFGLINWNGGMVFDEVQADLEAAGYEVQPYVLPACAVNAPHRMDRVWFVAYRNTEQRELPTGGFQPQLINGGSENDTYADSNGQHRSDSEHEKQSSEGRFDAQRDFEQMGRDAAYLHNKGLEGCKVNGSIGAIRQKSHEQSTGHFCTDWQDFPTQPPVCTGNDGFSEQLDGITFSKWRNESIKAAGNAIVPQVVFQIFKSIEEYEKLK